MFKKLWNDEMGVIISSELVLVMTILVIGSVTGLASVRDAVVTELADVGAAIGNLDQSFTVGGVVAHSAATTNASFLDTVDFCDSGLFCGSSGNSGTRCLNVGAMTGFSAVGTDTGNGGTAGH